MTTRPRDAFTGCSKRIRPTRQHGVPLRAAGRPSALGSARPGSPAGGERREDELEGAGASRHEP
ncbi:hypothetical protein EYF80_056421 [Liparis tanakae]|uniref:Uncharacterized protein n=1 Tax=Liparis tanakae TaxID=230148 RepID=A0A4Z2EYI8_9TELE|nr:hypothetical protein EYF80_056421 [Liparis tanakae]